MYTGSRILDKGLLETCLSQAFGHPPWMRQHLRSVTGSFHLKFALKWTIFIHMTWETHDGSMGLVYMPFFCLNASWLNEGSSSGRSPFCQRKLSEKSQIHWQKFSMKATIEETNNETKTPTTLQSPGECRGGWV